MPEDDKEDEMIPPGWDNVDALLQKTNGRIDQCDQRIRAVLRDAPSTCSALESAATVVKATNLSRLLLIVRQMVETQHAQRVRAETALVDLQADLQHTESTSFIARLRSLFRKWFGRLRGRKA